MCCRALFPLVAALVTVAACAPASSSSDSASEAAIESTYRFDADTELAPFSSDRCSLSPDGAFLITSWADCCVAHDVEYWIGGEPSDKDAADAELRACVERRSNATIGAIYFAGVQVGGSPHLPTTFKWGYGWRGDAPAWHARSPAEVARVHDESKRLSSLVDPAGGTWASGIVCVSPRARWSLRGIAVDQGAGTGTYIENGEAAEIRLRTLSTYAVPHAVEGIDVERQDGSLVMSLSLVRDECRVEGDESRWPLAGIDGAGVTRACCMHLNTYFTK